MADQRRIIDEASKKAKRAEIVSSTATIEPSSDGVSLTGTAFAAVTSNVEGDSADDDVSDEQLDGADVYTYNYRKRH